MNVFQFAPHFVFGVVLGVLVVRTGSVWPAILFHFVYNALLFGPLLLPGVFGGLAPSGGPASEGSPLRLGVSAVCVVSASAVLAFVWRKGKDPV